MPGVGYWDTGEAQTVPPLLGTFHPTGFPTYALLGWIASIVLQPFGDAAFRMNLLNALLASGSAALTVVLVNQLTGRTILALAAGIALGAIPVVWRVATHADAHMLHLFLTVLLFVILVAWARRSRIRAQRRDRWLVAAAVVYGLSLGNHTLTLLLAPGIALFVLVVDWRVVTRWRLLLAAGGALVVTTVLVYLELPLRAGPFRAPLVYADPSTWDGFRYVVLAEQFRSSLYQPFDRLDEKFADLVRFADEQLGPLLVLVPFGFVAALVRRLPYAILSGVSIAITCWFSASYINAEIDRYYLVPALIAVTWIALLAATVLDGVDALTMPRAAAPALPPATEGGVPPATAVSRPPSARPRRAPSPGSGDVAGVGALVVEIALSVGLLIPTLQALPERSRTLDHSADTGAGEWARAVMARVDPGAVIVSWWSYSTPLWYVQHVEGRRPDVWIVDDRTRLDENLGEVSDVIEAELPRRPVYLVRLDPGEIVRLESEYELERIEMPGESLLRVVGPRQRASTP
jgi:hypothetical protein